jgi:metal-responsive CopG/Arc/MetJ family transcriptional regulator
MPSVSIHLDDVTWKALERIVRARSRADFIRRAVREAIRNHEYARIREAYSRQPDSAAEADNWASCEKFEA